MRSSATRTATWVRRRACTWYQNGAPGNSRASVPPGATADIEVVARTRHIFCNGTTDYVELGAFQESGGSLNKFAATPGRSSMSVRWVHT
jgi:hypothetical protein